MSLLYDAGARAGKQWPDSSGRISVTRSITVRSLATGQWQSQLLARLISSGCLLLWFLVGWSLLSLTGCSKGQVKLSETEQQIQKIDAFLLGLQEVYGKKDLTALKSFFSPKFQDQHPELFQAVQKTFEGTDQVQMDLTVDLIHMDGQKVKVLLHWDVSTQSAEGSPQHRGNSTLQLIEQEILQIIALKGDNPFVSAEAP